MDHVDISSKPSKTSKMVSNWSFTGDSPFSNSSVLKVIRKEKYDRNKMNIR